MDINTYVDTTITRALEINPVYNMVTALIAFVATIIILKIFKGTIWRKLESLIAAKEETFDGILFWLLDSLGSLSYAVIGLSVAVQFLVLPAWVTNIVYAITMVVVSVYVVVGLQSAVDTTIQRVAERKKEQGERVDSSLIDLTGKFQKVVLWGLAAVLILSNLGYDVTALVATLGIGGMALAFGLQRVIEDIFSSFSIYLDEPFEVGDFIEVGSDGGTVKHIGIKSTRIQTLPGTELVIPNRDITGKRINNYKVREKRRVVFGFGVKYETPTAKVKRIPEIVTKLIEEVEHAEVSRVHLTEFGDYALKFGVVYLVDTTDYTVYIHVQQDLLLKIKEALEDEGIEIAYPTQTHFVVNAAK